MHYSDIIAQRNVTDRLRKLQQSGRIPHALLFNGPEGTGTLPAALAFASALLCAKPDNGEACGQCEECAMTRGYAHPDLHFAFPVIRDKAQKGDPVSDQYLTQWREQLEETPYFDLITWLTRIGVENQQAIIGVAESDLILQKLSLKPARGGYKVMVIWRPELMNDAAANKLLKILEEPPLDTVFILVSNHPEKLLTTILSRTQRIDFPPLATDDIAEALVERNALQPDDAHHIARRSEGNFVKALAELRINTDEALFFDMFVLLMRLSYQRKIKDMYEWAEQTATWGRERQKNFLAYTQRLVRENFVYNFRRPELNYMSPRESEFSVRFARFINERNVIGITEELDAAQRDIEQNVNPRMVFFDLALKMIVLLIQ